MTTRFVIYSETNGVFLGDFLGMGFWSKLDPVGQDSAIAFDTSEQALELLRRQPELVDARVVPVETNGSDGRWVTNVECVTAGLPFWDPDARPESFRTTLADAYVARTRLNERDGAK